MEYNFWKKFLKILPTLILVDFFQAEKKILMDFNNRYLNKLILILI